MSKLAVVLLTYNRTEYAIRTIEAFRKNIRNEDTAWYIADDGSPESHVSAVVAALEGERLLGLHSERIGYGAGANRAWAAVNQHCDTSLWLEDDWILESPLEAERFMRVLDQNKSVGMIRLGYLNKNMRGWALPYCGNLYWLLERGADSYVFTGHPSFRHRRFYDDYGGYPEGLNPGETELGMAYRFRMGVGSEILYPAFIGEYGLFGHIGAEKSY